MTGRRVRMLALHPLWRKARRVYSLASRLPGTNRLGFQPSLALSVGCELGTALRKLLGHTGHTYTSSRY
ncbi:MAG: hypothetical protein LC541_04195 [Candidatus Thiodiazotropha sp.]|nr:hypothetical protein [Candidatus Thiodiazotropha sp.]MCM8882519.1 hypothetical protein [Candidatus Thiodiazotropha sp.]